jgi:Holliday junction resolvase RusA-like endonuclease
MRKSITFTIIGEPASKANSRKKVTSSRTGKTMFVKSDKALLYARNFALQCPKLKDIMLADVSVELMVYYASRRPDLDESLILDCMEGRIYKNDRQVKVRHAYWGLDRKNPRAIIKVTQIDSIEVPDYLS